MERPLKCFLNVALWAVIIHLQLDFSTSHPVMRFHPQEVVEDEGVSNLKSPRYKPVSSYRLQLEQKPKPKSVSPDNLLFQPKPIVRKENETEDKFDTVVGSPTDVSGLEVPTDAYQLNKIFSSLSSTNQSDTESQYPTLLTKLWEKYIELLNSTRRTNFTDGSTESEESTTQINDELYTSESPDFVNSSNRNATSSSSGNYNKIFPSLRCESLVGACFDERTDSILIRGEEVAPTPPNLQGMHLEKPQDRADNLPAAHLEEARNEPSHSPDTYMVKTIFPDADLPTIHVEGSPIRVSNLPAIHAREPQIRNLPDIHVQEPSIHPVNSPTVPRGNPVPNVPSRYLIYNDSKTYDYYSDDFIPFLSLYYDSLPGKPWQNLESVTMTDQINPSDKSDHLETNNSKFHKSESTEISMNEQRDLVAESDRDSLIIEQNDYTQIFNSHREPMARQLLPLAVEANFQDIDRHNTKQSFLTNSILLGANSKINDTARTDVEKADEKNIHERFSSKFNNFPIPNFKSNQDIAVNAQNFVPDISKLFNSETTENYPATNEKYIVYLGRDYATYASQNITHVTFNNDYRSSPSFNNLNHSHHSIGEELFFESFVGNASNTMIPDEKEENTSEEEEKFTFFAPSSSFKSMDYKSESLNTAEPENPTSSKSPLEQDHIVRNDIENIHGTLKSVFQRATSEVSDENRYSSDGIFSHDHLDEGNESRDSSITDDPTNNSPDTGVTKYVNDENKIKTPILFLAEDKYLDGSYNFEYRSADGTSRQEVGTVHGEGGIRQHGRFAFRNGNGYETRVVYTADEKGYLPIISYSNSS